MMLGGSGIGLGLRGKVTNALTLPAGETYIVPAGNYAVNLGPYTELQYLDPVTGIWRTQLWPGQDGQFAIDGANYRLANLTGCPVAAVITTALATGAATGIGVTATLMTVTASSGSSTWCPIVGGALSLTCVTGVTGSSVGAGYLFPPTAIISAPPPGGLQATAHVTGIPTTGALLAAQVIIDNQGAGYPVASTGISTATITFVNDPRDTAGSGATVRLGATGTGQLTALYPLTQGVPLTGAPTLAFGVGAAGATSIMNFTVTAIASGTTNTQTYATGTTPIVTTIGNIVSATPAWTNPIHEKASTFPRPARIQAGLASNVVTSTGAVVEDGGFGIQQAPSAIVIGQLLAITGVTLGTAPLLTIGGVTDTSWLQPI